jgi:hypothetical protein
LLARHPIILEPIGATRAPLHKTYVEAKNTLVTDLIKKFSIEIRVYWHLIPKLANLLTKDLPRKSGAASATITLKFFVPDWWAFLRRFSIV